MIGPRSRRVRRSPGGGPEGILWSTWWMPVRRLSAVQTEPKNLSEKPRPRLWIWPKSHILCFFRCRPSICWGTHSFPLNERTTAGASPHRPRVGGQQSRIDGFEVSSRQRSREPPGSQEPLGFQETLGFQEPLGVFQRSAQPRVESSNRGTERSLERCSERSSRSPRVGDPRVGYVARPRWVVHPPFVVQVCTAVVCARSGA